MSIVVFKNSKKNFMILPRILQSATILCACGIGTLWPPLYETLQARRVLGYIFCIFQKNKFYIDALYTYCMLMYVVSISQFASRMGVMCPEEGGEGVKEEEVVLFVNGEHCKHV